MIRRVHEAGGGAVKTVQEVRAALEKYFRKKLEAGIFAGIHLVDDAHAAASIVRNLVRSGVYAMNAEVNANRLAELVGVHRNTMSKALNFLASEGYLYRRQGRPARVVSARAVLPGKQSKMISHTEVAKRYHLEIASDVIRLQPCRLSGVYAGRRDRVARHLELGPSDDLIILNRIRKVRTEGAPDDAPWIPALAETAYFAEARLPSFFYDDLHTGGRAVESISDYMKLHGIEVVNSEYRIRISPLTEPFHAPWAKLSGGVDVEHVKALRFLRFESVTHCHLGPLEFSIAYLKEGFFAISATDLTVDIRPDELAQARGRSDRVSELPIRRRS